MSKSGDGYAMAMQQLRSSSTRCGQRDATNESFKQQPHQWESSANNKKKHPFICSRITDNGTRRIGDRGSNPKFMHIMNVHIKTHKSHARPARDMINTFPNEISFSFFA